MSTGKYIHEYQKGAVNGASPLQLVIMLYDGALRFMEQGKHAMGKKDYAGQSHYLTKAQTIISELIACLDLEKGGEIAHNLLALYTFCNNQLLEANIHDLPQNVDVTIRVLSDLRESWVKLAAGTTSQEFESETRLAA